MAKCAPGLCRPRDRWHDRPVTEATKNLGELVAAVDLGSNSFHMIVGRLDRGTLTIIDKMRERVRLGAGLDDKRRLTKDANDRALDCLQRFGQRVREMPHGRVRVVGTNTLRKMKDSDAFLYEARLALGHPVEIIAGLEEARLIYLGVSQTMPERGVQRLVVDIGGGSTECIIGRDETIRAANSLFMGCVDYSLAYFADGELSQSAFETAEIAAMLELQPIVMPYKDLGWDMAVGCSGTVHAIRKIVTANGWSEPGRISREGLLRVKKALVDAEHLDRVELDGLHEDRRPVIAGGVAILTAVFEAFQLAEMTASPGALREGALHDLVGRIHRDDVRDRTIGWFERRYNVDTNQSARVERLAVALWDQVKSSWDLDTPSARPLLEWSAALHEVGLSISYTGYHKHSAYVVANADMAGFSTSTQALLAAIIRAHRRRMKVSIFEEIRQSEREETVRLAVLFRLAVALCRGRSDEQVPAVVVKGTKEPPVGDLFVGVGRGAPDVRSSTSRPTRRRSTRWGSRSRFATRSERGSNEGLEDLLLDRLQVGVGLVDLADLVLQLGDELPLLQAVSNDEPQVVVVPRLFEVLVQTDFVDALDRVFFVGVAGQDDARGFGLQVPEPEPGR